MRSPLGPALADILISKLENGILQQVIGRFTMYRRYVDYIFCITPATVNIPMILGEFNRAHCNIKFIQELELNSPTGFSGCRCGSVVTTDQYIEVSIENLHGVVNTIISIALFY